jgi:hypothetical protein
MSRLARAAQEGLRMAIIYDGYPEMQVSKETLSTSSRQIGGLVDGFPE